MEATGSAKMSNHDYRLFDVDNHYYEPDDVILRHIEPEFREQVPLESVVASTEAESHAHSGFSQHRYR